MAEVRISTRAKQCALPACLGTIPPGQPYVVAEHKTYHLECGALHYRQRQNEEA